MVGGCGVILKPWQQEARLSAQRREKVSNRREQNFKDELVSTQDKWVYCLLSQPTGIYFLGEALLKGGG